MDRSLDKLGYFLVILLVIPLVVTLFSAQAEGLMLSAYHLIIPADENKAQIKLINSTDQTEKYRISFVEMTMTPSGELKRIEPKKEGTYASDIVIFSPRRVKLPPGTSQNVLLQVRRPGLRAGEYRSHILFKQVPLETSETGVESQKENEKKKEKKLKVVLKPLVGTSIPVVVRRGKTHAKVELTDLQLIKQGKTPKLDLTIRRSGNRSVYGNFEVTHISKAGKKKQVGIIKGISVYTCLEKRNLQIALGDAKDVDLSSGSLQVIYRQKPKYGGKLIDKARIKL